MRLQELAKKKWNIDTSIGPNLKDKNHEEESKNVDLHQLSRSNENILNRSPRQNTEQDINRSSADEERSINSQAPSPRVHSLKESELKINSERMSFDIIDLDPSDDETDLGQSSSYNPLSPSFAGAQTPPRRQVAEDTTDFSDSEGDLDAIKKEKQQKEEKKRRSEDNNKFGVYNKYQPTPIKREKPSPLPSLERYSRNFSSSDSDLDFPTSPKLKEKTSALPLEEKRSTVEGGTRVSCDSTQGTNSQCLLLSPNQETNLLSEEESIQGKPTKYGNQTNIFHKGMIDYVSALTKGFNQDECLKFITGAGKVAEDIIEGRRKSELLK